MAGTKYVVIDDNIFLFDEIVDHGEFARAMTGGDLSRVKSAGFFAINEEGSFDCYGKSISLDIASREGVDTEMVKKMFKLGQYAYL